MRRIEWIDVVKGICAILVILMHSIKPDFFSRLFVPIFLPAFFFVAGYMFQTESSIKSSVKKQFKLFILYGFTFIAVAYTYMRRFPSVDTFIGMFLQRSTSQRYPEAILWFIPCLIGCRVLFSVLHNMAKTEKKFIFLEMVAFVAGGLYIEIIRENIPWHIEKVFYLQIFMLLGYLFRKYENTIVKFEKEILVVISLLYLTLVLVLPMDADLNTLYFTNFTYYTVQAIVGTITLVLFSRMMCNFVHGGGDSFSTICRKEFAVFLRI